MQHSIVIKFVLSLIAASRAGTKITASSCSVIAKHRPIWLLTVLGYTSHSRMMAAKAQREEIQKPIWQANLKVVPRPTQV